MLLFATVGGFSDCKASTTQQFAQLMGASGIVCGLPLCEDVSPSERLKVLTEKFNPRLIASAQRMLITNLIYKDELDWVEKHGGYVVHIDGRPSAHVPMKNHHFYVTSQSKERGRFSTVEQVYQAMILRYRQHAKRLA